ncbi:MAG: glycine--tRNA ligase [Candidatus Pacebacteria bacterium]|nr:glycine--tRNA ligase [Candidatus Paceibacterota bacterium]PIR60694.1 MAG: glycine--tRNA ligase [Candidatus Pacebacteria bacterium CG10_big_fil_rev_8_21_14_0_10_44_54]
MQPKTTTLDDLVSLAKRRGFVFQTSSIYGGLANSYDYGPLGTELLRNIKNLWWQKFIHQRPDMVGLDSQILLHPKTWMASGHTTAFNDPLVEDLTTQKRYRADHLIEEWQEKNNQTTDTSPEDMSVKAMDEYIIQHKIVSPDGNPVSAVKVFNLLFETSIGVVTGEKSKIYLRGETAQGIFSNFANISNSTRMQLPFGVGQIGKSFRNEVTTGQFVFRTLEFEQAEIEYFFDPETTDWQTLMESWKTAMWEFVTKDLHIAAKNLRWRKHTDTERSHYSMDTYDLDYKFPFGWKELWGIAYRTDYDLKQHQEYSGETLQATTTDNTRRFTPHVIEPAVGINRLFMMVLAEHYWEDTERSRTVLCLPRQLSPHSVAVFPLARNKPELIAAAKIIYQELLGKIPTTWDDRSNIGKRYLYQDEIGTPFCITIDYQTLEDNTVTIRNRDTTEQTRIGSNQILEYLAKKLDLAEEAVLG